MKTATKVVIIVAAVVVVGAGAVVGVRTLTRRADGISYITRPVAAATVTATVSETGTVNPVNTVSVGSEVSGTIRTLGADFNDQVKKGQILATLDPTTYQAAVDSAEASLRLDEANLNSAMVNVGKMKSLLDMANLTVQRDKPLFDKGLIAQSQMDADTTAAETANEDHLASQAGVQVAQAQVDVAKAQVAQAQYNLSKTVIRSPLDGVVMARSVNIGQTVAASLQTPTLFSLATNLTDMQVDTSVDEADAGNVHAGAAAHFTVTSYPNETFSGTVVQVRVNPTVVQNVVTYDAVVAVHDTSGRLLPGMTAQVTIEAGTATNVLAVPISALLYRPLTIGSSGGSGGGGLGGGLGAGGARGAGLVQSSGPAATAQQVAGAPGSQVTVWVLQGDRPVARRVLIGLSDNRNVQITGGDLQQGDEVIIAQRRGAPSPGTVASARSASPGAASPASASPATASGASASGASAGTRRGRSGSSAPAQGPASLASTSQQTP